MRTTALEAEEEHHRAGSAAQLRDVEGDAVVLCAPVPHLAACFDGLMELTIFSSGVAQQAFLEQIQPQSSQILASRLAQPVSVADRKSVV